MHIGIIREGKVPVDHRVPFSPAQLAQLKIAYPDLQVSVQSSPVRCFADAEYQKKDLPVVDDLAACDVIMGIKEVPIADLIPHKTYVFFSHTAKKQSHNKALLKAVLDKNIRLIDYEYLLNEHHKRVVAFGRYAGIVGAHNALWGYGKRSGTYALPRAKECASYADLCNRYQDITWPPLKIVITGSGQVGQGAAELMTRAKIPEVSPQEFLSKNCKGPVYAQLRAFFYHERRDHKEAVQTEFYTHPERYRSVFLPYARAADVLIAGAYWHPKGDLLFTNEQAAHNDFRIKLISDITCDVHGSIPPTQRTSTIEDPIYEYDPHTKRLHPFGTSAAHIAVIAIDYLPCELPKDASHDFGEQLFKHLMPPLLNKNQSPMIEKATIAQNAQLTKPFAYLNEWIKPS